MSGATDYIGLITVADGEAYDPDIMNANNTAIDAQFKKMKYSTADYTPTFSGLSVQGTGNVKNGSYIRIGKLVIASFYLKGGTGASLGLGVIEVTLPFNVTGAVERIYYGTAGFHSPGVTGTIHPAHVVTYQGTNIARLYAANTNAGNKNAFVTPGTMQYPFLNNDVIRGSITYRTDDA